MTHTTADAQDRTDMGMSSNPLCPDHTAHSENAFDRLFPDRRYYTLTTEEAELVDAEAEDEYLQCEGH